MNLKNVFAQYSNQSLNWRWVTCRISNQNSLLFTLSKRHIKQFSVYIPKQYSNIASKMEETINRLGSTISDAESEGENND